MAEQAGNVQLSEYDIAFILSLLKNASSPVTTATLVEEFRKRAAR